MAWKKHILFWIIVTFVVLLIVPIFASPQTVWGSASKELQLIQSAFGYQDTKQIADTSSAAYKAMFVDTGVVNTLRGGEVSLTEREKTKELMGGTLMGLTSVTNNYVLTFSALIYVMTVRLYIMLTWAPFIFPFMAAVVIDGMVRRKVKMLSVRGASTVKFSLALHAIIIIFMVPVLYLLAPFAVSPLFVPGWALFTAVPLLMLITNVQPMSPT
jgi:hypothetical protein